MALSVKGYNRLAAIYVWLERLAFGNALMQARVALISELKDARCILILGEGDGRFLRKAFDTLPAAKFVVLEQSPLMIKLSRQRFSTKELKRIQFIENTLPESPPLELAYFDVIVSCFFLDMFETTDICNILETFQPYLRQASSWYYVDFRQGQTGFQALYSWLYLKLMYGFFAWQTGLKTQNLVNPHNLFEDFGFRLVKRNDSHANFLTTRLYQKVN